MKKRELWLFILKLTLFASVLGYIWFSFLQVRYPHIIKPIASPIFSLLNVEHWWMVLLLEHFTNIIPYVALVLAAPDLFRRWKRNLWALMAGTAVLLAGHILLSTAIYFIVDAHGLSRDAWVYLVPVYLINDALPLILWLLFYPDLSQRLFGFNLRRS